MFRRIQRAARGGLRYNSNHRSDVGIVREGQKDIDLDSSKHEIETDMDASKHEPQETGMNTTQVSIVDEEFEGTQPPLRNGKGEINEAHPLPPPSVSLPQGYHRSTGARSSVSPATAETGQGASSDLYEHAPAPTNSRHRKLTGIPVPAIRRIELSELTQPMSYLGSGEFCTAFATTLDGQPVVVKMLRPEQQSNPTASSDLQSEIHLMTSMSHPNVLGVIAMGHDPAGFPFLVLEKLSTVLSNELPKAAGSVPL